jgi:hypothetical protein
VLGHIFEAPEWQSEPCSTSGLRCTCQQLRVKTLRCVSTEDMGVGRVGKEAKRRCNGTGPSRAMFSRVPNLPCVYPPCHGQPHQRRVSFTRRILRPTLAQVGPSFSIEIATRAADHFTRLYYSAYDSSTRIDDLPNFYRPNSAVSWNGNPYEGSQGVRDLISKMPKTLHEVQSFDCHPIPGACHIELGALLSPCLPLSRQAVNPRLF